MNLHCLSDTHFEHMSPARIKNFWTTLEGKLLDSPSDIVVLAGDICQIHGHENLWLEIMDRFCQLYQYVIYVKGNHEYYYSNFQYVDNFVANNIDYLPEYSGLYDLDTRAVQINGVTFRGGTMWFPDSGYDPNKMYMQDFAVIKDLEPEVYERHQDFVENVTVSLNKNDVVVTHHLPLPACIAPQFEDSPLNRYFMADMTNNLVENKLPRLWINGHTHTPVDHIHTMGKSKMRSYCNPHGYPVEGSNPNFWDRVAITV